jgi:hypothetical protein
LRSQARYYLLTTTCRISQGIPFWSSFKPGFH